MKKRRLGHIRKLYIHVVQPFCTIISLLCYLKTCWLHPDFMFGSDKAINMTTESPSYSDHGGF